MKYLRHGVFVALLLVLMPILAEETPDFTIAHRRAIIHMLKMMHAEEIATLFIQKSYQGETENDPDTERFLREFMSREIIPEAALLKMTPTYAKYLSEKDAEVVADFYSTSSGRKIIATAIAAVKDGKKMSLESAYLSPEERNVVSAFSKSASGIVFFQSQAKISADNAKMWNTWGADVMREKLAHAFAQTALANKSEIRDDPFDAANPDFASAFNAADTPFDQLSLVIATNVKQSHDLNVRFVEDMKQFNIKEMFKPQELVSHEKIADKKRQLQLSLETVDRYLKSRDEQLAAYRRNIDAIAFPAKYKQSLLKNIDATLAKNYDDSIGEGEIYRTISDLYRRLYDFVDERQDKMTLKDGKLVFAETADLEIFRGLLAQIKIEADKETALVKEAQERYKTALDPLRNAIPTQMQ